MTPAEAYRAALEAAVILRSPSQVVFAWHKPLKTLPRLRA